VHRIEGQERGSRDPKAHLIIEKRKTTRLMIRPGGEKPKAPRPSRDWKHQLEVKTFSPFRDRLGSRKRPKTNLNITGEQPHGLIAEGKSREETRQSTNHQNTNRNQRKKILKNTKKKRRTPLTKKKKKGGGEWRASSQTNTRVFDSGQGA